MGKVTDELNSLINKQVQDYGIVVWYDPEQTYAEVVNQLNLPETTIFRYTGSFFELRYRIEPFLEFIDENGKLHPNLETPLRLLVYIPLDRGRTQHALVEAEAAGVVMEPGASPWQRNTRLKILAERVFKRIAPDRASAIAQEVDAGRRTLAELDWLAEQTGELGAVKLIFGTTVLSDVVLAFLSSEERDEAILNKNALPELTSLFETELGLKLSPDQPVGQVRDHLCRSLLMAELKLKADAAGADTSKLAAITIPEAVRQREQLLAVCQQWRNRLNLRESYAECAEKVQAQTQVIALGLQARDLADIETFSCIESLLLERTEAQILDGAVADALEGAIRRKSTFWPLYKGEYQLWWTLLEIASQFLLAAGRIESELKTVRKDAQAIIDAYTKGIARVAGISGTGSTGGIGCTGVPGIPGVPGGEQPLAWCILDRHQRHLERRYAMLELRSEEDGPHAQLEKVMSLVRRRYTDVVGQCAECLAKALAAGNFEIEGTLSQDRIFSQHVLQYVLQHVHGRTMEDKTAYILVDSLRYEMGQELIEGLGEQFKVSLVPALAQLPTITEVGMASLMPGADKGMELVDAGGGKVGIKIQDALLKDRASRLKYFESKVAGIAGAAGGIGVAGVSNVAGAAGAVNVAGVPNIANVTGVTGRSLALKLNDLMKPTKKQQQEMSEAGIILVTSQEIDRRGEETEDEEEARRFMDEVLEKLRRGIRRLASLGVRHVIIAADHGHLFVEELDDAMKIDSPGGQTVDLHPRAWIGRGGNTAPGYIRAKASELGLSGDLEIAFPLGLACFRTRGGSGGYFHGGISLQEMVVPIARITVQDAPVPGQGASTVILALAKPKITTRFFSIEARYVVSSLFGNNTRRVKVIVLANRNQVGVAAMAAYGFEEGTQEIVLEENRPDAITMMLTCDVDAPTVSVHVLDATTHVEIAAIKNIPVEISI